MEIFSFDKVAKMLRKKRKRIELNQKEVANRAGLSPSQVNRIEKKSVNPSYKAVYKISQALDRFEDQEIEEAADLINQPIVWASRTETLEEAKRKMRENNFSQLPVKSEEEPASVGRITESGILERGNPDLKVGEVMSSKFLEVNTDTGAGIIKEILKEDSAVLVKEENKKNGYIGIITKTDLL